MKLTKKEIEKYKKYSFGELVDAGICPNCFNKYINGEYFGDESQLDFYCDEDIECKFVPNPRSEGHCMIASSEHYHDMSEAPDYVNEKIIRFAKQLMQIIKELYGCERVYLCTMSDGPMNHYHVQLIPRYSFEDRGSKNFVKPRKQYKFDETKFNEIKEKINDYAMKNEINIIKTITDKDFGLEEQELRDSYIRYGARGIVFREDGKIAVFVKTKMNEYKLPGGGIEKGESPEQAFKREVLEETGCEVEILEKLGCTVEIKSKTNFKQISHVFVGKVAKDFKVLNLTEKEKGEGAKLIWLEPCEAMLKIKNSLDQIKASPVDLNENEYITKFVAVRDKYILEYYFEDKKN